MLKKMMDMRWGSTCLLVSIIMFFSVELLQISAGNAVLVPEEENVLEILREKFNQPTWTGDPCANVAWIECSNGSQSSHVATLNMANKNLTGTIPAEVGKLRNIQELLMNSNNLTGEIPDLSNMTQLRNLDLKANNLSGPILDTVVFTDITRIVLDNNSLTGGIPPDLFKHPKLQFLYLKNNPLGGSLPNMSGLTGMKELSLENIQLTGSIPESIQLMSQATNVLLAGNPGMKGSVPNMSAITQLQYLDLRSCGLNGSLPDLRDAPDLVTLDVQLNDLSGSIPPALFQHEKLRWLNLNNNSRLSGEIPDTSGLLTVENFMLNDCNLTGAVPSFKTSVKLLYVDLERNRLTTSPSDFRHLINLILLNVGNNSITGRLPDFSPSDTIEYLIFRRNRFSGGIPMSWSGLTGVKKLKLEHNNLSGVIQKEIGNLTSLQVLLLGHNKMSGSIPGDLGRLSQLEILDLSNNKFSGNVPDELASLPALNTLLLQNNRFTGIPEALINLGKKGLNLTYDANVKILVGTSTSGVSAGVVTGLVIGFGVLGAVIVILGIFLFRYKRKKKLEDQLSKDDLPKSARGFTMKEIKRITGNNKTLIGKGGFGPVYYGQLPDGKEVAVKQRATDSKQGAGEFLNEVRLLSRLHHRNIVPLVGYCLEGHQQILVYSYMAQGTLDDHLYHTGSVSDPLERNADDIPTRLSPSWKTRLDIAINAARGLEYLHKDCSPPVIHRDVKASNILLTDNLQAKLADLGLSKQVCEPDPEEVYDISGVSTAVKGTFGYLDPEYFVRHKLTTKSDVYSFGMVLLEIITGKRPHTQEFPGTDGETTLVEWVRCAVSMNELDSIVDPAVGTEYNKGGMLMVVRTALLCVLPNGAERPDMGDILPSLTEALEMENESVTTAHKVPTVAYSGQLNYPITSMSFSDETHSQVAKPLLYLSPASCR